MNQDEYITNHIDGEPPLLAALNRKAHVDLLRPRMIAGHLQGRILKMLVRMYRPQRILEIGTYTGYATLCLAEGLPEDGEIHTIEIDDEMEDFIRNQFNRSDLKNRIHLHIGNALDLIPLLEGMFDMVFIDADKRAYCEYYEAVFDKVKKGGIILADNTLWSGKVLEEPHPGDKQTLGIIRFNEMIAGDRRVEKVILPLRDGLTIIYKNSASL
ncbi:MAG: O-methyltransferase [Dysgonamonadaceae bacterium]|jgi:predicted O-methyltransferase YrrM|nr:O-methyltransferase [Dysgonamonadaceae bacterium]